MATLIHGPIDVRLYYKRPSTIRTWLLILNLIASHGAPLLATITDISAASSSAEGARPLSRGSVGRAIRELEALGVINVERRGHMMAFRVPPQASAA